MRRPDEIPHEEDTGSVESKLPDSSENEAYPVLREYFDILKKKRARRRETVFEERR